MGYPVASGLSFFRSLSFWICWQFRKWTGALLGEAAEVWPARHLHTTVKSRDTLSRICCQLIDLHGLLRNLRKLCSLIEIYIVVVLNMVWRSSIKIDSLMRREVCNRLLHVVIVNYLRLSWELTILMERSGRLLELLWHRKRRICLPIWLVLEENLLFCASFSPSLLFWWLWHLFIEADMLIILVLQSEPILARSPPRYRNYIILASVCGSI